MILLSLSSDKQETKSNSLLDYSTTNPIIKQNISLDYLNNISKFDPQSANKLRINNSTGGIEEPKFSKKAANYFSLNILKQNDDNENDNDENNLDNTIVYNDNYKNESNINLFDDILSPINILNNLHNEEKLVNITSNMDILPNNLINDEYLNTNESEFDIEKYDLEKLSRGELNQIIGKLNHKYNLLKEDQEEINKAKEELKIGFESKIYIYIYI